MGKIFDDYVNNTPQNVYAGSALEDIKGLNKSKNEQYVQNKSNLDALDIMANNLDVNEADYHHKVDFINSIKSQTNDLIKKGDYENASLLVQKMMKDYQMNNNLQGALTKQSQRKQYEKELNDRLRGYTEVKEKDGSIKKIDLPDKIDQSTYNYGMYNSKENAKKSVNYNAETGQIENGFSVPNLIGDKSKEIYDKIYSRLEKFKEDGIIYANGRTFRIDNARNSEYVLEDGKKLDKSELYNALKQEIEGTPDYMDWINQTKNIKQFNTLLNPDGTKRNFNADDFKGYTEAEIKAAANNGIGQSLINKYQKANETAYKTNQISKEEYENTKLKIKFQQDNYNKTDINDPKNLEKAWNREQHEQILNSLVNPAADAGAHILPEHKIFEDHLQTDFALESFKDRMKNIGFTIYNIGNTSEYSGEDYQKIKEQLPQLESDMVAKKQLYEAAKGTSREQQREKEYNKAVTEYNIGKEQVNQFYVEAKNDEKYQEKVKNNVTNLLQNTGDSLLGLNDIDINKLIDTAKENKDYHTIGLLESFKTHHQSFPTNLKKDLIKNLSNINYTNDIVSITNNKNKSQENMYGNLHHYDLDNYIQEKYNDKALTYATDSGIIKDNGFKDNSTTTNQALGTARALLGSTTDLKLPNGDNFNNAISNTQVPKFFEEVHEAKNNQNYKIPASFSMENSDISVGMNRKDGRLFLTINPKTKEGKPLFYGEDANKANKQAVQVTIGDENAARDIYYKYAKVFEESGNPNKALEIRAEANFANTLNRIVVGKTYKDPITLSLGALGDAQFYIEASGKESVLKDMNGKPVYTFNDISELKVKLEKDLEGLNTK